MLIAHKNCWKSLEAGSNQGTRGVTGTDFIKTKHLTQSPFVVGTLKFKTLSEEFSQSCIGTHFTFTLNQISLKILRTMGKKR